MACGCKSKPKKPSQNKPATNTSTTIKVTKTGK